MKNILRLHVYMIAALFLLLLLCLLGHPTSIPAAG